MLAIVPAPLLLFAPGNAVDLASRIAVRGYPSTRDRFYLTDVAVIHPSVLLLALALDRNVRIVERTAIVPRGVSAREFDRFAAGSMLESQNTAAIVAERAAGRRVPTPPRIVVVAAVAQSAPARALLRAGDEIVSIDGRRVRAPRDVRRGVSRAQRRVRLGIVRLGAPLSLDVPTFRDGGRMRLGILATVRDVPAVLPLPVRFDVGDVGGSSGGLMFALQIYADVHGFRHAERAIAGTGTLDLDGTVGPIEGTRQKLVAAERANASLFLVPRENYAEIAASSRIRIVPVDTFAGAIAALGG